MSHRFVRCPHCKMPHDAAERVCPNTGLRMPPTENRAQTREGGRAARGSGSPMIGTDAPAERKADPFPNAAAAAAAAKASASAAAAADAPPNSMTTQHHLLGQTVGGRYKIRGVLGEGGMGTVYDAEHLGLSRQVAIKVLSPTQAKKRVAVKRFQQEARAAGAIGHPNICEVYDLGLLDDGSPYLVMEKLIGQTLAERIGREGGLPFDEVVEVIAQVLSGLTAAHDKGIVHRDIKPENIFLARRLGCPPIIKLLDFGVSKMMPEFQTSEDHLDLTRTGMVMGTPYYMSPEQARGERNLDGRVDVYACGVVMYEALAGKRPFLAPNYNALLLAIINTMPKPLRELRPKTPPELEAIIMRAMAKNRNDRYPTAKHFLHDLMPGASTGTTGANPSLAGAAAAVAAVIPPAEGSGSRLPAPPTAEERIRAQILGGGRVAPSAAPSGPPSSPPYREPIADGPSMTLQSRMQAGVGGGGGGSAIPEAGNTRIERRPKLLPAVDLLAPEDQQPPSRAPASVAARNRGAPANLPPLHGHVEDSDEVDIPIHVAAEDEPVVEFEDPTEVFRPGMALPSKRKEPAPLPAKGAAAAQPRRRIPPRNQPIDDWDGETVVKRPEMDTPPTSQQNPPASRQPRAAQQRAPKPFNPDETLRLDTTGDHELERHRRRR